MTDEAQGIPRDITPEEACRLVTGALYPKEMALLQETQRQLDEERRMLDETRERCKALESELSSARMRIDRPLRDAWLGEAIAALAERVVAYRPGLVRTDWPEKCPDCNEDRKIAFTSPQGNACTETCQTCGARIVEYQPVEYVLASVRKRFRYESGADGTEPCDLYYAPSGDDDVDGASRFDLENVVAELPEEGGMPSPFKTQHEGEDDCYPLYSDTLFCDKRDCQTACDWINSREGYPRRENYRWWEANRHGRSEGAERRRTQGRSACSRRKVPTASPYSTAARSRSRKIRTCRSPSSAGPWRKPRRWP